LCGQIGWQEGKRGKYNLGGANRLGCNERHTGSGWLGLLQNKRERQNTQTTTSKDAQNACENNNEVRLGNGFNLTPTFVTGLLVPNLNISPEQTP
jgi:hypothetical protein